MDRKAFRLLLKKYLDNSCTEEEKRILDRWYDMLDSEHEPLSSQQRELLEEKLWNRIEVTSFQLGLQRQNKVGHLWWKYAATACIVALIAVGYLWFTRSQSNVNGSGKVANVKKGFFEEINNTNGVKTVQLEDGTSVAINPGSKLVYPVHFEAGKREVYLEGDAYFLVSKHPDRPFFVYNNHIVTQVLGTSFDIRSKRGQVEVAVKTGRVAVYENKEQVKLSNAQQRSNGIIITPNQKVIYYEQERHFVTSVVDHPIPVVKESGTQSTPTLFKYNETPLSKVLKDLEDTYGLEIDLENDNIANCLFTGDLTDESLFNKLKGICLIFNASYEIKGTTILLKGTKGCTSN